MPSARRVLAPAGVLTLLVALAACGDTGTGADTQVQTSALSVQITPKSDSLGVGGLLQLSARVTDHAGAVQQATVAWMSLNTAIASVSATGNVTALAPGRVGVVATIGTAADTASLYVRAGELVVEPNAVVTAVGEQLQFSAETRAGITAAAAGLAISWSSSDPSIATVDDAGTVTALAAGDVSITATSGDKSGKAAITVRQRDIASIRISPTTSSIYSGATQQLQAVAYDDVGKAMAVPLSSLRWTSSSQNIASVDDNGLAIGKTKGAAVVTAKLGGKSATASLNVLAVPVSTVAVTLDASSLDAGQSTAATAILKDANGNSLTDRTVAWQSSNSAMATVNSSGVVTAIARGSVTITAISEGKLGSAALTVASKAVASVAITPGSASATVGQTAQLTAVAKDGEGIAMAGKTFTWASSNAAVATVSPTGLVTAVAPGTANISATTDGVAGQASFTSAAITAASVSVSPPSSHVEVGKPLQLTATAYDASGNPLASRVPTWSSSNPTVATVSNDGRVTGLSVGNASISATVDGKTANASVTVDPTAPQPVATVAVSLSTQNVNVGQTAQASAVLRDAAGNVLTGRAVTWSSAEPQLATVSSNGLVTTIGAGSVSIVATSEGQSGSATLVIGSAAPAPVATVTLTATSTSMLVGQSQTLSVTLKDAQGTTLTGRTIAWSSSSLPVLTVSPSGTVTAVGAGTATITATSEGKTGSVTITNTPASVSVATVTVSSATTTLNVAQTAQASFTAKDNNGAAISGKTATWSSSAANIASVSSSGVITGVAAGQAVIKATVDGVVGSLGVTINAPTPALAAVTVTLGATSLNVGQTTQASAAGSDASGAPFAIGTPTWSSSNTAVATVSSSGVVTAVAPGSASITATVSGKSGSASVGVSSPPTGGGSSIATPAELPRSVPSLSFGKATRTVQVTSNLQAALNNAQPGDSLVLSGTFTGNFVLPARPCGAGITITSAGTLPSGRMTPTRAAGLAKITTPTSEPALKTTNPTCGWRIAGLEISCPATAVFENYGCIWLGDGGGSDGTQVDLAHAPQDIVLDRIYCHGTATSQLRRCIYLNSRNSIIRDSWISEVHSSGSDSQAILMCNGPGPYLIDNNHLEGAGENIMAGGCDPRSSDLIPSDMTIRRNHFIKPLVWKGKWSIKNLFELKNARRVLLEDNVFENSWIGSQVGMAIVIKSSTENCIPCTWEGTKDVTVRYNIFRNANRGLNVQSIDASSSGKNALHTERVTVYQNLFTEIGTVNGLRSDDGWLMLMVGDLKDVSVCNNTFIGNTANLGLALMMSSPGAQRFEVCNNVLAGQSYYAVSSDQGTPHTAALTWYAGSSWRFTGNVVSEIDQEYWTKMPTGNQYFTAISALGLRSDGSVGIATTAGANIATLLSRTQGVVQSP